MSTDLSAASLAELLRAGEQAAETNNTDLGYDVAIELVKRNDPVGAQQTVAKIEEIYAEVADPVSRLGYIEQIMMSVDFSALQDQIVICGCCQRPVDETPYEHTIRDTGQSWEYCQECYDWGCGGPMDCVVEQRGRQEKNMSDTDTSEVARLEGMLAFDVDENGGGLTDAKRAEFQARLSILRGDPEADEQDAAMRSLLGGGQTPEEKVTEALSDLLGGDGKVQVPVTYEDEHGQEHDLGVSIPVDAVQSAPTQDVAPHTDDSTDAKLAQIQAQLAALTSGVQQVATPQPTITLKDVLDSIDPRDSDAALALFNWLWDNQRFGVVGTLNGGGYLLHYQEPKGTTQAGYTAGGTQGSRMVDAAVEKAKEAGAKPVKRGMCPTCMSAVREADNGVVVLDDPDDLNPACPGNGGGAHTLVS